MKSCMGTLRYCGKSAVGRITCCLEMDDQEGCLSGELLFFFLDGHLETFSLAFFLFFMFNFSPKLIFSVRVGACNQLQTLAVQIFACKLLHISFCTCFLSESLLVQHHPERNVH